jgi:NAD(P)-dependent dehydrogenase (short-subunit alcohol dehydrogenase family)
LKNKVAIVTGGAQGIGKAVCLAFAGEGADVVVADIVPQKTEEVSGQIRALGRKSLYFELDVLNGKQVEEMVDATMQTFGKIDLLANVAGIIRKSAIEDLSEEDWDRVMGVNLKGTFLCSQAVGRKMIKQDGGCIINMASIAGHTSQINAGAYSPSKAGVISLTKLMAVEWAKYNIRVNAVSPGPVKTPLTDFLYNTEELYERRAKAVPMNRFASTEEVADTVVFLACDQSKYITGHSLAVDGGALNGYFHVSNLLGT